MVYTQNRNLSSKKETDYIFLGLEIQTVHPIKVKRVDLVLIDMRKITFNQTGFPADHRMKVKEEEKGDGLKTLALELKELIHTMVNVTPVVSGDIAPVLKKMKKRLNEVEMRKTTERK